MMVIVNIAVNAHSFEHSNEKCESNEIETTQSNMLKFGKLWYFHFNSVYEKVFALRRQIDFH